MRSRTSFFNRAFSRHLLRRFWPLWALWLALLLIVGVFAPAGNPPEAYADYAAYVRELNRVLLHTGVALACCGAAAGPIAVMCMLGYLYHPRACGMVNALPMRREEAYFTAALTGLAPMLAADALVWLLILARFGGVEGVDVSHIHLWLLLVVMGNTAFYGMACFCGVLTGSTVVAPLVFTVLGFTAAVVESCVQELLSVLVYGYTWDGLALSPLAPLACLFSRLRVVGNEVTPTLPDGPVGAISRVTVYHVEGVPYLAALCAAGLVLLALAALILRRRHMETAGEIVAVPVLRPIFRVCMAVGTGLVFSAAASDGYFRELLGGRALAAVTLALLVFGAALGFFIAEMLIKKTLRVFDHGWRQLVAICVCLVLPFLLAEFDVTGYEKRVPDAAEVESIDVSFYNSDPLTEPESIAAYCDFHRRVIAHKADNDGSRLTRSTPVTLRYTLKNGGTFSRVYRLPNNERAQADPDSDLTAWQAICNLPEAILQRARAGREISADSIRSATVQADENVGGQRILMRTFELTPEQAAQLYHEGILPDAQEGNIARWYAWASEESDRVSSNVWLQIELYSDSAPRDTPDLDDYTTYYHPRDHINLEVLLCSAHTIRWLEQNLGLTPVPRVGGEVSPIPTGIDTP